MRAKIPQENKEPIMIKVGDVVRLNRGWTAMIVLHITPDNEVWAKYASRDKHWPITEQTYEDWRSAYSYHRDMSGFTAWDGEPINEEWNHIMPQRYRNHAGTIKGVLQGKTSNGMMILETDSGNITTFQPHELVEDLPDTFRAKAVSGGHYTCHYIAPTGVQIYLGDILVSDSGNMYRVMDVNTKARSNKGVFKGCMVSTVRFNEPGA
jgi:hypothetical protein